MSGRSRHQPFKAAVRPDGAVVELLSGEFASGHERTRRTGCVPSSSRSRLLKPAKEGILLRLARGGVVPVDAGFLRSEQDRHAGQPGALSGRKQRPLCSAMKRIELASYLKPGERGIGDQRQAFAGEVVEDGEDAKPPAVAQLITKEIQRRALPRSLRQRQRRPGAQRSLVAAATTDLKGFRAPLFLLLRSSAWRCRASPRPTAASAWGTRPQALSAVGRPILPSRPYLTFHL